MIFSRTFWIVLTASAPHYSTECVVCKLSFGTSNLVSELGSINAARLWRFKVYVVRSLFASGNCSSPYS